MKNTRAMIHIINHYGYEPQHRKAIEECQELIEAIENHLQKPTKESREHLIDEMADVSVMLDQLNIMNACMREVEDRMEYKLDRQMKRMEEEKNDQK